MGIQAGIPLTGAFNLQPELFYSAEGAKMKIGTDFDGDQIVTTAAKVHLNYLNLPVLLQYRHASGFLVQTGPQLGYLLSARLKMDGKSDGEPAGKAFNRGFQAGVFYTL